MIIVGLLGILLLIFGLMGIGKECLVCVIYGVWRWVKGKVLFLVINFGGLFMELGVFELFGYVCGVFMGVDWMRKGVFWSVFNGVLFLDELVEVFKGV